MTRSRPIISLVALMLFCVTSTDAMAQEAEEGSVIIPSRMKLDDEQKAELQKKIETSLSGALKKCVAKYPRPEFFTTLAVEYQLKKSGSLRGGYLSTTTPDSNLYVKSEEELEERKRDGTLARLIVQNDRDLERCLKKATRELESGLDRYSAEISANFTISWEAKTPSLDATTFEVVKK